MPHTLTQMTKIVELDLSCNGLTDFFGLQDPSQVKSLFPRSLKMLNLAKNKLTVVLKQVYVLPLLETADLSGN